MEVYLESPPRLVACRLPSLLASLVLLSEDHAESRNSFNCRFSLNIIEMECESESIMCGTFSTVHFTVRGYVECTGVT